MSIASDVFTPKVSEAEGLRARGKIVLPGGGGFLGEILARHFALQGREIVILSRRSTDDEAFDTSHEGAGRIRFVRWDGETSGAWARELDSADAVINLAGRSVNCRYHARNRREILQSRLHSTAAVGAAIARCEHPPPVWINSSSATIYRHALDRPMDEAGGDLGSGFSVDVCRRWEAALDAAATPHTRRVALRLAMVLGATRGGVMDAFERIVRLGLGGTLGRGDQFVSWVHATDFARTVQWIIEREELSGPVNCASPHPIPNVQFMRVLRRAYDRRIGLPATRPMLEIGSFFLRTETELLLKSRRVVPSKLLASGFAFQHPRWEEAARYIVQERAAA